MKMETRMAEPEPVTELSTFSSDDAIPTDIKTGMNAVVVTVATADRKVCHAAVLLPTGLRGFLRIPRKHG
jgi:hypothetical protein